MICPYIDKDLFSCRYFVSAEPYKTASLKENKLTLWTQSVWLECHFASTLETICFFNGRLQVVYSLGDSLLKRLLVPGATMENLWLQGTEKALLHLCHGIKYLQEKIIFSPSKATEKRVNCDLTFKIMINRVFLIFLLVYFNAFIF